MREQDRKERGDRGKEGGQGRASETTGEDRETETCQVSQICFGTITEG